VRIRRGLLFWGLFLIPLGAFPLLVRGGVLRADQFGEIWRLWPIVLIAIGAAIIVGRGRASIAAIVAVALVLGSFAGAALAAGPGWIGTISNCSFADGTPSATVVRDGAFAGSPAQVRLELRCGSATVRAGSAAGWHLDAVYRGAPPLVDASGTRLELRTPGGLTRQDWTVQVPSGSLGRLDLTADAASTSIDLTGLHAAAVGATVNAGDLRIDAGAGAIDRLDVTMNAGRIRLNVGPSPLDGAITANAGAIELCVPDGSGLRVTAIEQVTFGHNLGARGLVRAGDGVWTRSGPAGAPTVALRVEGNAASLTLNPEGGCR
jgi:hypothetical protein